MNELPARVLIAVDGSSESIEVVRYVGASARPENVEIVLYTVLGKVPEVFWDMGKDPLWQPKIEAARKWEKKQLDHAMAFMASAVQMLKEYGFLPTQITTRISPQETGIARDIIAEARRRYDVLVIGRGKSGPLQDQVLGSVADKIVSTATAPALWLVGRNPISERMLFAMDNSESALRIVRHGSTLLTGRKNRITLFHAIRSIVAVAPPELADIFPYSYQQQLLQEAEREMEPVMLRAEALLNELDISPERIETRIARNVRSRAAAIMEEAATGGHGTIVAGRRGVSEVADFAMGRVVNKLIRLARDQTLCIVG